METNSRDEQEVVKIEEPANQDDSITIDDSNPTGYDGYHDDYDFYPDSVF